jgi:hypothetical protein
MFRPFMRRTQTIDFPKRYSLTHYLGQNKKTSGPFGRAIFKNRANAKIENAKPIFDYS